MLLAVKAPTGDFWKNIYEKEVCDGEVKSPIVNYGDCVYRTDLQIGEMIVDFRRMISVWNGLEKKRRENTNLYFLAYLDQIVPIDRVGKFLCDYLKEQEEEYKKKQYCFTKGPDNYDIWEKPEVAHSIECFFIEDEELSRMTLDPNGRHEQLRVIEGTQVENKAKTSILLKIIAKV